MGERPVRAWGRWGPAMIAVTLVSGLYVIAAGTFELLSNRNLKPGWTRYQPPWTVPVLIIGIALVVVSLSAFIARYLISKRRAGQPPLLFRR
jgi:hypothetical protein